MGGCHSYPMLARRPSMPHPTPDRLACQVESLRRQVAQTPGLPFADVLDADTVARVLADADVRSRDCVFTPLVTVRCLLSQAIDADGSCQQLLARQEAGERRPRSVTIWSRKTVEV